MFLARQLSSHAIEGVRATVVTPTKSFPTISIREALTSLGIVVVLEVLAVILLFLFLVPPSTKETSLRQVTARQALARPAECADWQDVTVYGPDGLRIPGTFAPGEIHLRRPVLGDDILKTVPVLNCTAASGSGQVSNVQNYNDWTVLLGNYRNRCVGSGILVLQAQGDLSLNCYQAYGHIKEVWQTILWKFPPREAPGTFFACECISRYEDDLAGNNVVMQVTIRWPDKAYRLPLQLKVTVLCAGLPAIAALLGSKAVNSTQLAALDSSGLCLRADGRGSCVVALVHRWLAGWAPAPEYLMVEVMAINVVDAPLYNVTPTDAMDNISNNGGPGPYVQDYPELAAPGAMLDMDLTVFRQLAKAIILDPQMATVFGDFQYLTRSCPGRNTSLGQDMDQFLNSTGLLAALAQDFEHSAPFWFSCLTITPPSFLARCSAIWPTLSIVHAVAATYAVRIAYRGIVTAQHWLGRGGCGGHRDEDEDEDEASAGLEREDTEEEWEEFCPSHIVTIRQEFAEAKLGEEGDLEELPPALWLQDRSVGRRHMSELPFPRWRVPREPDALLMQNSPWPQWSRLICCQREAAASAPSAAATPRPPRSATEILPGRAFPQSARSRWQPWDLPSPSSDAFTSIRPPSPHEMSRSAGLEEHLPQIYGQPSQCLRFPRKSTEPELVFPPVPMPGTHPRQQSVQLFGRENSDQSLIPL